MKLSIGQRAPAFSLFNSSKERVNLDDFKGRKVVLLFFPQAFTGVCTKELCSVRDNIAAYNNINAQVLGISVDSVFTLNKYKQEQSLNFPLLSDFNKEVSAAYGSLYDNWVFDMKGVSKRSAFVIDEEGIIRYAEVLENAGEIPDFGKINEALQIPA
ncbi:MAG TPA: peroxiredoxin [Chitinophagaceae bacterium]|nr:peroxiredoxin [Chitinophagaceae bacterium]